jgi:soluble lytic murein transglycosylase-like protein
MARRYAAYPPEETDRSPGGGCLSGFLLPPLAVVLVGSILALLLLGSGPVPTLAAAPGQNNANLLQATMDTAGTTAAAAANPAVGISPVFQPEVQYWSGTILAWANAAGLDPNLVATVMQIESCGDPRARSRAGAMGLFQVMPFHFTDSDDPYDPDTNARRGLAYLQRSLEKAGGQARLAFAGYNGGIGVIGRLESSWAGETQRYAYWGSGIYTEASSGAAESLRLQEWMNAGGASLCRQAHARLGMN